MPDAIAALVFIWLILTVVLWLVKLIRRKFNSSLSKQAPTASDSHLKRESYPLSEMDAEIAEKDRVLELFLIVQKTRFGGASIPGSLRTDLERSKYLHFVVGAIDQLSSYD